MAAIDLEKLGFLLERALEANIGSPPVNPEILVEGRRHIEQTRFFCTQHSQLVIEPNAVIDYMKENPAYKLYADHIEPDSEKGKHLKI